MSTLALALSVVALSLSRSAVFVAVIVLGGWLAFVPVRLRSALLLGLGGTAALPVILWALSNHALSSDAIPMAAQNAAGHRFGVVLLVALRFGGAVFDGSSSASTAPAAVTRGSHWIVRRTNP